MSIPFMKHFFYKSRTVIVSFVFCLQMLNYLHRIIDFISILFQGALQENFQTKYCKSTGQTFGDQSIRKAMIFKRSSQKHRLSDHWRIVLMQGIQMKLQILTKVEHNFNY